MRINRITCTPQRTIMPAEKSHSFCANPKAVKETLINCSMFAAVIGIGAWLAKLFKEYPKDDSIFLNDGTYFCADYFMSGLGSNSCGPLPPKRYRVPETGKGRIIITFGK